MKRNQLKTYFLQVLLIIILILALFKPNIVSNMVMAIILFMYMIVVVFLLKKRKILSIYYKQVTILMVGLAIIYLGLFYLLGVYFGFYKSPVPFGIWGIIHYILPFSVIVISSEIIRYVFLSQKSKMSGILTFVAMVLIDIVLYTKVYDMGKLDDILAAVGFVAFASVSCNLLYNYVTNRYGYMPVMIYRLITVLYAYIIPILPDVYIFFRSIGRMIYPYLVYLVIEYTYSKTKVASEYRFRNLRLINTTILVVVIELLAMLISCKFKYGILVIGSESMTGAIYKGDSIIYESYNNQALSENDIIVFENNNMQVVHRIVDIKNVNNKNRYYTKGDFNQSKDIGYITDEDIIGIVKYRIPYIGYPTLWLKEMID